MARDIKTGRMLHRTIAYDEKLNSLSIHEQWFYFRILPFTDDFGRLTGNLFELIHLTIPSVVSQLHTDKIRKMLNNMQKVKLIKWKENESIELLGFEKNQKVGHRRKNSLYPDLTPKKKVKKKPILKEFEEFWNTYPSKRRFDKQKNSDKYRLVLQNVEHKKILKALNDQIKYTWKDIEDQYIPHLSVWLNQSRWELDVVTDANIIEKKKILYLCNSCGHENEEEAEGTIPCPKCKEYDYMSKVDALLIKNRE